MYSSSSCLKKNSLLNHKLCIFLSCIAILSVGTIQAQVENFVLNERSPYSGTGLGFRSHANGGTLPSIANVSSAYRDPRAINIDNPASHTSLSFVSFDVGARYKLDEFQINDVNADAVTFNFQNLLFAVPKGDFTFGAGFFPSHLQGYSMQHSRTDEAGQQNISTYEGGGSLTNAYLLFAYQFTSSLSLGIRGSYVFGTYENAQLVASPSLELSPVRTSKAQFNAFQYNLGVQYHTDVDEERIFTVGGYLSQFIHTKTIHETYFYAVNQSQLSFYRFRDAITQNTLDSSYQIHNDALPLELSLGASYLRKNHWFVGGDYKYENISSLDDKPYLSRGYGLRDAHRFAIGGFIIPDFRSPRNYFARIEYRAGAFFESSHVIDQTNNGVNHFGFSVGLGLPGITNQTISKLNISAVFGQWGDSDTFIKNQYASIVVNLSLNDVWFIEFQYD